MKNLPYLLFIFFSVMSLSASAQNSGKKTLNYQAVILDPKAIDIPGASISGQPLNKGNVCLRFSLLNAQGGLDYEETQQVITDEFGLVSVAIGTGIQGSSQSVNKIFNNIIWDANIKSLQVSVSYDACGSFKQVSTQILNYTPYALYAEAVNYKNVREAPTKLSQFSNDAGYLIPKDLDPIKSDIKSNTSQIQTANQIITENKQASDSSFLITNQNISSLDKLVATNTSSITTINTKINDQQNQISDNRNQLGGLQGQINVTNSTVNNLTGAAEVLSNKSTATDLGGVNTSDQLYPSQKAAKTYVDQVVSQIATSGVPDATTLAAGKIQLAGDLGGIATNPTVPGLVNKANLNSPTFIGTPTAPTPASSDNSTKLATTAFVATAVSGISGGGGSVSVGSISNTSTSFGASINAGVLNLAPADGSNGGIVTTGAQSFAGAKTFSADLVVNSIPVGRGGGSVATNTALGVTALGVTTTGFQNTAIGHSAMKLLRDGLFNTAIGADALNENVSSNSNTAVGASALRKTNGGGNVGIGTAAFSNNISGISNVAVGSNAGALTASSNANTSSDYSIFIGEISKPNAAGQTNQIAIGYDARGNGSNTIQLGNTAITNVKTSGTLTAGTVTYPNAHNSTAGQVLTTNVSGVASWATPAGGGTALTMGSISGTSTANGASINAGVLNLARADESNGGIVTTGTQTFGGAKTFSNNLVVNGIAIGIGSGLVATNTAFGYEALKSNTSGYNNIAIGYQALLSNTTGYQNTTTGYESLRSNISGRQNTAIGYQTLYSNTTGRENTALGYEALKSNLTGIDNTATGWWALRSNTTGANNTATGFFSLAGNTIGAHNTAYGNIALQNNQTGFGNTAIGSYSLVSNTTGGANVANGYGALSGNTTGSDNVAIGQNALSNNETGSSNIALGRDAGSKNSFFNNNTRSDNSIFIGQYAKPAASDQTNQIVIGYDATGNGSNTIQLGNDAITLVKTKGTVESNGTALTSDLRLKSKIVPLLNSLATVMQLNPVHYIKKSSLSSTTYTREENGFVAQEIQKILPFIVTEGTDENKLLSVDYNSFIPLLAKAVQEQQKQIEDQNSKIAAQQKQIEELIKLIKGH